MRWTDKLGGRKFIISVLVLVLAVFAIDVPGESKLAFLGTVLGAYAAVNASSKNSGKDKPPSDDDIAG